MRTPEFNESGLELHNCDCMELMAQYTDKHFDLAIVDPPYGIGAAEDKRGGKQHGASAAPSKYYGSKKWDSAIPYPEYFKEIFRVSKNQIVWGANYFIAHLTPSPCWIFWDKDNSDNGYADGELAWGSFTSAARRFRYRWAGMLQENMKEKEERFHPTQKPVALYSWLLKKYATPETTILDTHLGSGSIAIACRRSGNRLVASEIDADYFKSATERITRELDQTLLPL